MSVRIYCWRGNDGGWFALCPAVGIGRSGSERELVLRALKREIRAEAEMIFGSSDVHIINGKPGE